MALRRAGPFTDLVVFGDSLSDMGNVSDATASIPFIATQPGTELLRTGGFPTDQYTPSH